MADTKTPSTNAEQLITEHLDIWTTAIEQKSSSGRGSSKKFSLHGIKKLRELILELAVRGKLVPQESIGESFAELSNRNFEIQKDLLNQKSLKTKADIKILQSDEFLDVPITWGRIKLGNLAKFIDYRGKTPNKIESGVRLITAKNVKFGFISLSPEEFISEEEYNSWMTRGFPKVGDLLFTPEAPLGNIAQVNIEEKFALAQRAICLQLHLPELSDYLKFFIMSPTFQEQLISKATGTTAKGIKASVLKELVIYLPPIEEQNRIVAKVDELMGLCDALEAQTENSIAAHQTLVEVLLEALLKAPEQTATPEQSTKQFQQNWQRLSEHFDTLFTTTASIDTLKQTILQLAVMGKLVPQNPDDQSVEDTLSNKDIVNRATLKEGKGALLELSRPFQPNELRYDLPRSWSWIRLGQVMKVTGGSQPPKSKFIYEDRDGYVRLVQIRDFKSDDYLTFVPVEYANRPFGENDIMIGRYGPPVFQILKGLSGTYNVALMKADVIGEAFDKNFLFYLLSEPGIQKLVTSESERTAGQSGVRKELIYEFVIGLPPIVEQRKIVTKIEQLMDICDQLKARLTDAQTTKLHLTDAIVEQTL